MLQTTGRKLHQLRINELKEALEKRNLGTFGSKAVLIERLKAALNKEGIDVDQYVFSFNKQTKEEMISKKSSSSNVNSIKSVVSNKKNATGDMMVGTDIEKREQLKTKSSKKGEQSYEEKNTSSEVLLDNIDIVILDDDVSNEKDADVGSNIIKNEEKDDIQNENNDKSINDKFNVNDMEEIDQVGVVDEEDCNFGFMDEQDEEKIAKNQEDDDKEKLDEIEEKEEDKQILDEKEDEDTIMDITDDQCNEIIDEEEAEEEQNSEISNEMELKEKEISSPKRKENDNETNMDEECCPHDNVTNGVDSTINDNEEGINLTIEEDEQQLLHDAAHDYKEKTDHISSNQQQQQQHKSDKLKDVRKSNQKDENDDDESDLKTGGKFLVKDEKEKISTTDSSTINNNNMNDINSTNNSTTTNMKNLKSEDNSNKLPLTNAALTSMADSGSTDSTLPSTTLSNVSRNLWVSGLSSMTRASDLKTIFSKYGKVIGAKVVTNTRTPGTRCYGYVTMASSTDASRCIDQLHRTELHGRIISVERTKNEISGSGSGPVSASGGCEQQSSSGKDDKSKDVGVSTTSSTTTTAPTTQRSNTRKKDEDKKTSILISTGGNSNSNNENNSNGKFDSGSKLVDAEKRSNNSLSSSNRKDANGSLNVSVDNNTGKFHKDEKNDVGKSAHLNKDVKNHQTKGDNNNGCRRPSSKNRSYHSSDNSKGQQHRFSDGGRIGGNRDQRSNNQRGMAGPGNIDRDRFRERDRDRERERVRQREMLSYQKIRQERERQRLRERQREMREEERRRREIRARQRQEEARLAEERRKLAMERERLEREKAELLRLERERQKLEREKIELERLELKRQQMKIMQARDEPLKRMSKRSGNDERYNDVSDRKRSGGNDIFEAPPPPRFDTSLVSSRSSNHGGYDKKRDNYNSSSSSKRLDDYGSSKRSDYGNSAGGNNQSGGGGGGVLGGVSSSSSKRPAIDDYGSNVGSGVPPTKRVSDDYNSKRGHSDYISPSSSKRSINTYGNNNGGGGSSSGGGTGIVGSKSGRDDYKREVDMRHMSAGAGIVGGGSGGMSSYHKSSAGGNTVGGSGGNSNSNSRYDSERSTSHNYRRTDDMSSSGGSKRYDNYGGGSGSNSGAVWASGSVGHMGHPDGGNNSMMKSYSGSVMAPNMHASSGWGKTVNMDNGNNWHHQMGSSSQDRYDRTYNERSGGGNYGNSGVGNVMYSSGSRGQDRYGGPVSSRY